MKNDKCESRLDENGFDNLFLSTKREQREDRNNRFFSGFLLGLIVGVMLTLILTNSAKSQELHQQYYNDSTGACYEIHDGTSDLMIMVDDELKRMDTLEPTWENFLVVCEAYGVIDPEILFAMARLESGNFRKPIHTVRQNPLSLRGKNGYRYYDHWSDCVKDYVSKVQYKRKPGEEMFHFLKRIGYAEDPNYPEKVKKMLARG